MLLDCPSPPNLPPKCRFCGGKHETESCHKLQQSLVIDANNRNKQGQIYFVDNNPNNLQ